EERAERVGADVGGETGDVGDRGEDLHGPAGDVGLALGHAPDRGLDVVRLAEERHAGGAGARVEDVAFGVVLGGQGGEVGGVLDGDAFIVAHGKSGSLLACFGGIVSDGNPTRPLPPQLGPGHGQLTHSSVPSVKNWCFQIGSRAFTSWPRSAQAANASPRCSAETAATSAASPIARSPIRCDTATPWTPGRAAISSAIARRIDSADGWPS